MRFVRNSLALALMGFVCAACDGLSIETARRTAADTGVVEDTGGSETDTGDDTALDTGAEDTTVDTATDTATDTAADTADATDTTDTTDTGASVTNACGGTGLLTYRGVAAGPSDGCGLCGDGELYCSGTGGLSCAGATLPNDCGGCGLVEGEIGTTCGLCGDGVWACGAGQSECVGDRPPNGCGGCTTLALEPGTECALVTGDAGVVVCSGRELSRCASAGTNGCGGTAPLTLPSGVTGVEPRPGVLYQTDCRRGVLLCDGAALVAVDLEGGNACGGCDPLLGEPGAECGACGGVWTCDAEGGVRCIGGSANACGGCAALAAAPGLDCDAGGNAGVTVCISLEETACVAPGSTNACGGLGTITGDPLGQSCGACADGAVACDATDALRRSTVCEGASDLNSCGGCGVLDGTVGSPCGTCGSGSLACSATSLVCTNDAGAAAENVCGGCSTLAASPGDPCGRCGTWSCDPSATGRLACTEPAGGCGTVAVCGNGAVEAGEGCDDGNAATEACSYADLSCTVCNASCQSVAGATSYCGDGLLDAAEVCDDGDANGAVACSVGCTCSAGYHLEGGVCTSDERACSVPNGVGTETWTGSSYAACVATACASGYIVVDGVCLGSLGAACTLNAECASGFCATGPDGNANDRCAPTGMNYIPAGTFIMGSPVGELGRSTNELQHNVTLTRAFFLDQTEVTQAAWKLLSFGINPSYFQNSTCVEGAFLGVNACNSNENANNSGPVERVDWYSALEFANAKSLSEGLTPCYTLSGCLIPTNGWLDGFHERCSNADFTGLSCEGYRLPSEAEWEYAARAGTTTATYIGNLSSTVTNCTTGQPSLDGIAWWCKNSGTDTSGRRDWAVGGKTANSFALYDMLGNVGEWTGDLYADYPGTVTDPTGPTTGSGRVFRGASGSDTARFVRAAARASGTPSVRSSYLGFRLARTVPPSGDCASGYHLEGGVCVSDTRSCIILNGSGTETWTGSSYGACEATACATTYHVESGACLSDTRSCTPLPANATASTQTWNSATSSYGSCTASACASGYTLSSGVCVTSSVLLPVNACADGSQTRDRCSGARIIGRSTAAASWTSGVQNTCSASDRHDDACPDFDVGNDHTYAIYLKAGERVSASLTTTTMRCATGEEFRSFLKFKFNPDATSAGAAACPNFVLCAGGPTRTDSYATTRTYDATADGWLFVIVDGGATPFDQHRGYYNLGVSLSRCSGANCGCP